MFQHSPFSTVSRAAALLGPQQLGVGVRGGCEAIAHAVRKVVEEDPSKWVLQVDLINSYNQVDRGVVLEETARHFPECLAWVKTCYGAPSVLKFGPADILSALGLHQGDPLAGLLFCLALKPVVDAIEAQVPTLSLNAWYCDDGNLHGTKPELATVVDIILQEGGPRGLILSTSNTVQPPKLPKSSVWSPMDGVDDRDQDPLQRGVPKVRSSDGITVLGAPVRWRDFVREKVVEKIEKVRQVTELLPHLREPHLEFVLLRSCLSLPKVMFLLRALDTSEHQDLLDTFDSITRGALCRILGSPVTDDQWAQAKLPVAVGGLGLRAAGDHASVAHATSLLSSHSMILKLLKRGEEENLPDLPQLLLADIFAKQGEDVVTESLIGVSQKAASLKVDLFNRSLLLNQLQEGNVRDLARLTSLGLKYAGSWLSVVPSPALGLHLRPAEFVPIVRYRLGINVYSSEGNCPACGQESDKLGDHALACVRSRDRIARHDLLRDVIYEAASSASLAPVKEERHLLPGTAARPGDVFIRRWSDGKDAALDVTVTSPLASSNLADATARPGGALEKAYDRKMRDTADACRQQGLVFLPIALETLGGMHHLAVNQFKRLGAALVRHTGSDEREVASQLMQRISLHLMRGNAAMITSRRPDVDFLPPEMDGVE